MCIRDRLDGRQGRAQPQGFGKIPQVSRVLVRQLHHLALDGGGHHHFPVPNAHAAAVIDPFVGVFKEQDIPWGHILYFANGHQDPVSYTHLYYKEIIDASDVLLTGKSELRLLYGDPDGAVKDLLAQKDRVLAVKDGSRGTSVYTRQEAFSMGVYPATEVDPTGAGDCFDATFLAMLCEGAPLRKAARFASAAGAKAVEKRGPMEGNSCLLYTSHHT